MGIDTPRQPLVAEPADVTEERKEELLEQFPEENQARLAARIERLSLKEQIVTLQDALKKRREALVAPRYVSSNLTMINKVSDRVFERFSDTQNQIEVGRGENGRVFKYASDEEGGATTVFKMRIRPPVGDENDLLSEGALQADVALFSETLKDTRIGVPHPYYIAASSKGYVLAMEEVPGYSLKDIREKNIPVPQAFDIDAVEKSLQLFIRRMNEAGFYHRDVREGNIMINLNPASPEAPIAYVIDFGYAIKRLNELEAGSILDDSSDYGRIKEVLKPLRTRHTPGGV